MKTPAEKFGGGPIVIADYNSAWPTMFEREREVVVGALGKLVLEIEHIGSTAIPGLPAKPIIDLLVGIRSLGEARSCAVKPLVQLGYVYIPDYEPWLPDELFFRKGVPGPWTHHVHVMEPGNPRWDDHLRFRDYLRAHPATAADYAELKKSLAKRFGEDIGAYRDAKDDFVHDVLVRARAGQ
jgi:GrpB-like predicted nucleotidyltransferase (UPF0157 family)